MNRRDAFAFVALIAIVVVMPLLGLITEVPDWAYGVVIGWTLYAIADSLLEIRLKVRRIRARRQA